MSNSSGTRTIVVPWRKVCATLPAVALICGGMAFSAPVAPARDLRTVAVSSDSRGIVVPDTALTMPVVPALITTDPLAVPVPDAPDLALVDGALAEGAPFGSSSAVALGGAGIPVRALDAYQAAASLVSAADPSCHIDWALLAAIGRVESNHARFGGNQLDADGVAQPGIIGIPLDGTNGTARITDSDGGRLDRDTVYDRAVGPMQFIPGTWRAVAVDADGDGVINPQDMTDAATAAAIYLCSGPGDLSRPAGLHSAIMRYNPSDSYVSMVTALADTYRRGVSAIQAFEMPAAIPPTATAVVTAGVTATSLPTSPFLVPKVPAAPLPGAPATPTPLLPSPAPPTNTPVPAAPVPAAPVPAAPVPAAPVPAAPVLAAPVPAEPAPAPVPAVPDPLAPVPAPPAPAPVPAVPDPAVPPPPVPCLPATSVTDPAAPVPALTTACPPDPCVVAPPPATPIPIDPVLTPTAVPPPSVIPGVCAIVPPNPTPTLIP